MPKPFDKFTIFIHCLSFSASQIINKSNPMFQIIFPSTCITFPIYILHSSKPILFVVLKVSIVSLTCDKIKFTFTIPAPLTPLSLIYSTVFKFYLTMSRATVIFPQARVYITTGIYHPAVTSSVTVFHLAFI